VGSLFGHEVASELALERLNSVPGPRGRLEVRRAGGDLLEAHAELTAWSEIEDRVFAVARRPDGELLIWCSVTGAWSADPGEGVVEASPPPGVAASSIEHRLVSVIVPLLLAERGDLVIHASAVDTDAGAVLFAGPSGRGKSTTVAALARAGLATLAEDGLVVELAAGGPLAWPGARGIRLKDPGEAAGAAGYPPGLAQTSDAPPHGRPVAAVVALAPRGDALTLDTLSPGEGAAALGSSLFHRGGPEGLRPVFGSLARLVEAVPSYLCSLPDDLGALSEAAREVVDRVSRR
jgi:hypothetical protein